MLPVEIEKYQPSLLVIKDHISCLTLVVINFGLEGSNKFRINLEETNLR